MLIVAISKFKYYLRGGGGAYWRVKWFYHLSISKAPAKLNRENTVKSFVFLKALQVILCVKYCCTVVLWCCNTLIQPLCKHRRLFPRVELEFLANRFQFSKARKALKNESSPSMDCIFSVSVAKVCPQIILFLQFPFPYANKFICVLANCV